MVLTREDEARNLDWDKIKDTLENRHEHNLDNLEVTSEFIEDLARYTGGSAELAYGLHQEFGIDSDQVIVDHRTYNSGQQAHMTSILIQKDNGEVVKDLYAPAFTYDPENPDAPENNFLYLRHNENTPEGGEQALKNAWNAENTDIFNPLHYEGLKSRIEAYGGKSEISNSAWKNAWESWMSQIQDVVVGYHSEVGTNTTEETRMIFTEEAHQYISQKEQEPATDHVIELSEQFYGNNISEEEYIRVHEANGELTFDITTDWNPEDGWATSPS